MGTDAPFEMVTKIDAAERQLREAIRLSFERRDLIAVHTLASAAQEVLRDLGRGRGIQNIFKRSDLIRPEYQEELNKAFNRAQNFFKHADRDADSTLPFYYETTKFYIFDGCLLFQQLTNRQLPAELAGFIASFSARYPNFMLDSPLKQMITSANINVDDFDLHLAAINLLALQQKQDRR